MTKIFNASIQDAKENQKQGATRNNAANQQANAAIMESLGGKTELSNREKVAAWYKKLLNSLHFIVWEFQKKFLKKRKKRQKALRLYLRSAAMKARRKTA